MTSQLRRRLAASALALVVTTAGSALGATAHGAGGMGACATTNKSSWPMFGHDLSNTRHQADGGIDTMEAATLLPVWGLEPSEVEASGDFSGQPIVANGCVFAGTNTGWLLAVDAETGELAWKVEVEGPIKSSAAYARGLVLFTVSRLNSPYVVALDAATGSIRWKYVLEREPGSETYSSPVPFGDYVFTGVSGVSPETEDADPEAAHHGSFSILHLETGKRVVKTYTIPKKQWQEGYAGGGVWPTPAIDEQTGYGYLATGNPYRDDREHDNVNSILKIDLNPSRSTFGRIIAHYKGARDEVLPGSSNLPPCVGSQGAEVVPGGESLVPHLDFGASPNLFRDDAGRLIVGDGQKSGVYHALDAQTFEPVWKSLVGPYGPFGGIVSTGAYDGERIVTAVTPAGYLVSLDPLSGTCQWVAPVADGLHYGHPVTSSEGTVMTVGTTGFLDVFDSATGALVARRPLGYANVDALPGPTFGAVSVAQDMVFATAGLQVAPGYEGRIVAFRPL